MDTNNYSILLKFEKEYLCRISFFIAVIVWARVIVTPTKILTLIDDLNVVKILLLPKTIINYSIVEVMKIYFLSIDL